MRYTRFSQGLPPKGMVALLLFYSICFAFISFQFILIYFNDTHQMLVELPQRVGSLATLFRFNLFL
jgi:hypothetical protein